MKKVRMPEEMEVKERMQVFQQAIFGMGQEKQNLLLQRQQIELALKQNEEKIKQVDQAVANAIEALEEMKRYVEGVSPRDFYLQHEKTKKET